MDCYKNTAEKRADVYKENATETDSENEQCGVACCKPRSFQFFNSVRWFVLWSCVFNFIEGFIVNGVVNIIIVALETRYGLSSFKSGMIASANDFGALPFLIIMGYIGERVHKPKWMGFGIFVMSLGCLLFILPHFIGGEYEYTVTGTSSNASDNVCSLQSSNVSSCSAEKESATSYEGYYAMLLLGQCLLGIGAVPAFTVGLTYIDDNSKTRDSALHMGFTFCAAALGVAVGYIAGGQFLSIFVDIDKVDVSSVPLTPLDPQWVGAWWIGIVIGLFAFLLIAFPILSYPRRLPNYDKLCKEKKSEAHVKAKDKMPISGSFGQSIKEFPRALLHLFSNPSYLFIVLGGTVEIFIVGGLATFGAKLFQEFHGLDLANAGFVMGMITIPGSGGGMLLGGYLIKRFNLRVQGIIRMSCCSILICMLLGPAFLASCAENKVMGVSRTYINQSHMSLTADCNMDCGCTTSGYEPICDHTQAMYFSPCHAGCSDISKKNGLKVYKDCKCIPRDAKSEYSIRGGSCPQQGRCSWYYVFCIMLFLMMLFTFTTTAPVLQAMLRSVTHKQRSFALGIQLLFGRLLGSTPGPIFLGTIIDSSCEVWQENCGTKGNCWVYKKWDLGLKVMAWWIGTKFVGASMLFIASVVYKAPHDEQQEINIVKDSGKDGVDNPVFTTENYTEGRRDTVKTEVENHISENEYSTKL